MTTSAISPPDPAHLARGRELSDRLQAIAAEVSAWADEATADSTNRLLRVQTYSSRVLAGLQSVGTDLGLLTLAMAEETPL